MTYGTLFTNMIESPDQALQLAIATQEKLSARHPTETDEIEKLCYLAPQQFKHYQSNYESNDTKILKHEQNFRTLHKQTRIPLVGSIDAVAQDKTGDVWLLETKCRGRYDDAEIESTLHKNFQTMFYWIAYFPQLKKLGNPQGVILNLIRRPNSDPNIRQRKGRGKAKTGAETNREFYDRILADISNKPNSLNDKPNGYTHYFKRFSVQITQPEAILYNNRYLTKYIYQLKNWYDWFLKHTKKKPGEDLDPQQIIDCRHLNPYHYEFPIGTFHAVSMGFKDTYWHYINTGSKQGLETYDQATDPYWQHITKPK